MPSLFGKTRNLPFYSNLMEGNRLVNPFGLKTRLPERNPPTQPSIERPIYANAPNFLSEYDKITGNRPNRLAYQQAIEQGPPVIERSKWARLGAALAGGASALGGESPTNAYNMGLSAYMQPQMRADKDYESKTRGLGELAQMENQDVEAKIRNLEMKQSDWYKQQELGLSRRNTEIAEKGEARASRESDARIEELRNESERANWQYYDDPTDGMRKAKNTKTGREITIGRSNLTSDEQTQQFVDKQVKSARALLPYDIAKEMRQQWADERKLHIQGGYQTEGRNIAADASKANKMAQLQNKINSMSPDNQAKQIYIDMMIAENKGLLPEDAHEYLSEEDGVMTANGGWWNPMSNDATRQKVKEFLGNTDLRNNLRSGAGNTGTGNSTTNTQPGSDAATEDLTKPGPGKTRMVDPDGKLFYTAYPEHYLGLGQGAQKADVNTNVPSDNTNFPSSGVGPNGMSNTLSSQLGSMITPDMIEQQLKAGNVPSIPPVNQPPVQAAPTNVAPNIAPPTVPPITQQPPKAAISNPSSVLNPSAIPQSIDPNTLRNPFTPNRAPNFNNFGVNIPAPTSPATVAPSIPTGRTELNPQKPDFSRFGFNPTATPPNVPNLPTGPAPIPQPEVNIPPGTFDTPRPANPIQLAPRATPNLNIPTNPIQVGPRNISPAGADMGNRPGSLDTGKPSFDKRFETVRARFKDATGLDLKVISGTRSAEEQAKLFAQGRSTGKKGATVTNADGREKKSKHQTGEAADIRFIDKNGRVTEGNKQLQTLLGQIAKQEGMTWGGDWKDPYDPLHIELGNN